MSIREDAQQMKLDAPKLDAPIMAATGIDNRNDALRRVKEALLAHADEVFAANAQDLTAAQANEVAPQIVKRLRFDEHKLADVTAGIDQLVALPDPVGRATLDRELDEGLELRRVTCPVQISTLCLKSGNCAILKGGRETANTNRVLFALIHDAAVAAGLPDGCLKQAESHADIDELLACDREVDLLIPRGSNAFVRYIMDHTKIPVMGHSDGICHMYIDVDADQGQALRLIVDAKTQYVAACNALETCLVDRAIAPVFLPRLADTCADAGVILHGGDEVQAFIPVEPLGEDGYRHEYLDMALTVALVDGVDAACDHINRYGSHHTDSICTTNTAHADRFCQLVDSAGVYVNASTRFADGFRYGFGAEVGISTGKIHARGPVGLDGLVTYKYLLLGHGDIVGDYASGKKRFTHRDLL